MRLYVSINSYELVQSAIQQTVFNKLYVSCT